MKFLFITAVLSIPYLYYKLIYAVVGIILTNIKTEYYNMSLILEVWVSLILILVRFDKVNLTNMKKW